MQESSLHVSDIMFPEGSCPNYTLPLVRFDQTIWLWLYMTFCLNVNIVSLFPAMAKNNKLCCSQVTCNSFRGLSLIQKLNNFIICFGLSDIMKYKAKNVILFILKFVYLKKFFIIGSYSLYFCCIATTLSNFWGVGMICNVEPQHIMYVSKDSVIQRLSLVANWNIFFFSLIYKYKYMDRRLVQYFDMSGTF